MRFKRRSFESDVSGAKISSKNDWMVGAVHALTQLDAARKPVVEEEPAKTANETMKDENEENEGEEEVAEYVKKEKSVDEGIKLNLQSGAVEIYMNLWHTLVADPYHKSEYDQNVFDSLEKQRIQKKTAL